ncbi:UvrD-helicase domain-containing protein [Pectobacterium carotovorum subsp. carotovorum]|uniref:UvrD-helicase domain-containing protein n=1 Tax=Pectobacterium carotovorum TaxID=554 RepID=UPI00091E026A|nr:UvrD-helicase domain-containing protein [Pectobacterium carotovorum]WDG00423.1 UvrD-helicase domain-containing protein [Pectobacterium carotovorum subsp. carotovorum]SHH05770.1 UvrD/REP helicase N-terminal domain-containing protein [Pectobacterium carotovorum]
MNIEISERDINDVERELNLSFDDARREIIQSYNDVQACPGSGKTTMVAAKLLIIAKKWKSLHQGVCVLTHTNVAKKEIIERLHTSIHGRKLLASPHFIGTIQEFVNKFIAIPYLRSQGFKITHIDDEICCARGWHLLNRGTKNYLERNRITSIQDMQYKFIDAGLKLNIPGFLRESQSNSYQDLINAKNTLIKEGYFFYHEMYEISKDYIHCNPDIIKAIQSHFPIIFIDEMQDTQKFQDEFLNTIFLNDKVKMQRFGDPDQAIYGTNEEENQTYNHSVLDKVENSHRFNNSIASIARNLSYNRINLTSEIAHPSQSLNTIFLVDDNSRTNVFEHFANLCSHAVPIDCEYPIKSVGAVGKKKENSLTICSYYDSFDKTGSTVAFKNTKLIQYIYAARQLNRNSESYRLILEGISHFGKISNSKITMQDGAQFDISVANIKKHLKLSSIFVDFNLLVMSLMANEISRDTWANSVPILLSYLGINVSNQDQFFLSFENDVINNTPSSSTRNSISIEVDGRIIENQIATIHSVKGETHAATLLLETKYHTDDITTLIDYILSENIAQPTETRKKKFMKQIYVALTRPKYLLCIAMNKSGFPIEHISKQEFAGWNICDLT